MDDVRNAGAVVTGGASGIGLATARPLGRSGTRVVLADVEQSALESAVDGLRATASSRPAAVESSARRRWSGHRTYQRAVSRVVIT